MAISSMKMATDVIAACKNRTTEKAAKREQDNGMSAPVAGAIGDERRGPTGEVRARRAALQAVRGLKAAPRPSGRSLQPGPDRMAVQAMS